MVTGKSYIFTLYTTLFTLYTWCLSISYVLLITLTTRQIYIFCHSKIFVLGKIKKKKWRPHKIFLFNDRWWRLTNRRLQFIWSRGLPVNMSEILSMLACVYIHRCWRHQKSYWYRSQNLCRDCGIFQKCAESAHRDHKPPLRVTLKCVFFVPSVELKFEFFSILCLTTDPIHQGHEKRKKSVTSARSPRNTSAQLRDR